MYNNKILLALSCLILLTIPYINTFHASWHLDDIPNIVENSQLHISQLTFQELNNSFRANPAEPERNDLYRPIPCFTFGLNWYIGQDNVFGYHVVNLAIHILTAWFLFLTLHLLLQIYYQKQQSPQFFLAAALLGTCFWALAPIQTQAVTYIVQRMASMSAMFSIIAIYAYLRGKTATKKKAYLWFILCIFLFFAALSSKENAILLPPSLVLLEISFFQHDISVKQFLSFATAVIFVLIIAFFFIYYGLGLAPFSLSNPLSFLDSYNNRSFTFSERILTQPRIVLMYLSQILLPLAERLSIEHDIILSTSALSPWTTLPAILTIFLLISISICVLKKYPLISFPILFFFLNHAVESTVLQLELIFEHRNYLPSFFLFLPLSVLIAHILYGTTQQQIFRRAATIFCTILFLIISGQATYTRNSVWATEGTLWEDAISKAPNSARAAHSLALWHRKFEEHGQAYYYFQRALRHTDKAADPKRTKKGLLNGLASVLHIIGQQEQSLRYFNQCLEIDEKDEICLKNQALAYLQLGQPNKAYIYALKLTKAFPEFVEYQYLTAVSAYQARLDEIALSRIQKFAKSSLDSHPIMLLAGLLMMREKAYPNSLFFLKQANKLSPNDIDYKLVLAAAYYLNTQAALTETVLTDIYNKYPLPVITNALEKIKQNKIDSNAVDFLEKILDSIVRKNSVRHEQQPATP